MGLAPPGQDYEFIHDSQYFAWMEIWLSRFDAPRLARFIAPRRPIYNRSAGGYVTLFFWEPGDSTSAGRRPVYNRRAGGCVTLFFWAKCVKRRMCT